ncbi:MAG: hypothetical protein IKZ99_02310 [Salinivirgaceae bacterium]|nr:hypothetical protein [Salinivirgaceae bacterium]
MEKKMTYAVLEKKMSSLTVEQQQNVESYVDFLLSQNQQEKTGKKQPLDFSKYDTSTRIWNADAQSVINELRS